MARATGLTRAAARRFLLTLVDLGHVRQDGKLFRLTPRVLTLGYAYLSSLSLPGIAEPHLEQLVREVHESSSMSVLDGHDIVYVARVPTSRIMTVAINVGTRFPAYATSMGRVLLAGLDAPALEEHLASLDLEPFTDRTVSSLDDLRARIDETRAQGYALVDQELEHGLRSIAAPVRNRHGQVVAAVNVSSHVGGDVDGGDDLPVAVADRYGDRAEPVLQLLVDEGLALRTGRVEPPRRSSCVTRGRSTARGRGARGARRASVRRGRPAAPGPSRWRRPGSGCRC